MSKLRKEVGKPTRWKALLLILQIVREIIVIVKHLI